MEDAAGRLGSLELKAAGATAAREEQTKKLSAIYGAVAELKDAVRELQSRPAPSSWSPLALAVCGQMLVLAAFLFYRMQTDRKRGHII